MWRSNFLMLNGVLIDVLVLEDTSHKPNYLIEKYPGHLCSSHLYASV